MSLGSFDDANFTWMSDSKLIAQKYRMVTISDLAPGNHTITLTVIDAEGMTGIDTVNVTTVPEFPLPLIGLAGVTILVVAARPLMQKFRRELKF